MKFYILKAINMTITHNSLHKFLFISNKHNIKNILEHVQNK